MIFRDEADLEIHEAAFWYEDQREELGFKFLDALDATLDRVEHSPKLYAVIERGVRRALVRRFTYVVYFRILRNEVEILAVIHSSRNSDAWKSRLN